MTRRERSDPTRNEAERPGAGDWDAMLPTAPWEERRRALRSLFEGIAPSYDRLNRVLSLGIDRSWRRRAAREALSGEARGVVLDLASGTGDQALALLALDPAAKVVRLDLSEALLRQAEEKLGARRPAPAVVGEMERIPVRHGSCAAVTMAFALRHVESLEGLLRACASVLAPGGVLAFVDMALPERGGWSFLYKGYFRHLLPRIAVLFGGERHAYELMVRSVETFPGWDRLLRAARDAGLVDGRTIALTGGAARVFVARKRSP